MYMCVYRVETIVRGLNHDDVMFATLAIFQQQMISNKIKTTNLTHITKTTKLVRDLSDTCDYLFSIFVFGFDFAFFVIRDVSRLFDDNCKAYAGVTDIRLKEQKRYKK